MAYLNQNHEAEFHQDLAKESPISHKVDNELNP